MDLTKRLLVFKKAREEDLKDAERSLGGHKKRLTELQKDVDGIKSELRQLKELMTSNEK